MIEILSLPFMQRAVLAALLLERACRVPRGPDDDDSDGGDEDTRR